MRKGQVRRLYDDAATAYANGVLRSISVAPLPLPYGSSVLDRALRMAEAAGYNDARESRIRRDRRLPLDVWVRVLAEAEAQRSGR